MNPNKALWEQGDFTEIAAFMRQSAEGLVGSRPQALRRRQRVGPGDEAGGSDRDGQLDPE